MKSNKSDHELQALLRTISLKDGFVDFNKFEIKPYIGKVSHKIARFGDEKLHQRKRPEFSGVKEAIYKKFETELT